MTVGAVADIHGNFDALTRAMDRHPDVPLWICVGDVASRTGTYPAPPRPLFWIKGNNEDFERIAAWEAGEAQPHNLHYIRNGTASDVGPLRVAGLGGTFAPTWFNAARSELPHGRRDAAFEKRDDKRRHFVREEAEACKHLAAIDILMTHEAARPFIVVDEPLDSVADALARGRPSPGRKARRLDAGKPAINDVLAALKPRLHLCGHHHRFSETVREGVPSVCIDRVNRSYLLIDAGTLDYRRLDQ
jgi:Icc-related predicted phosphoesterase